MSGSPHSLGNVCEPTSRHLKHRMTWLFQLSLYSVFKNYLLYTASFKHVSTDPDTSVAYWNEFISACGCLC